MIDDPPGRILSHLGDLEESLSDVNNTAKLLYALNASLNSFGVVGAGRVQDTLDLVDLAIGPLLVRWSTILKDSSPDAEQAECNDCFLIYDIVFVAEGVDSKASSGGQNRGLRHQRVSGQRIKDRLSLLLGLFCRDARCGSGAREGCCECWESTRREGRSNSSCA